GAVEERAQPVVAHDRGTPDFSKKIFPEHPFDGAPGVVGSQAEEEARAGAAALEQPGEAGNAFARAAEGVDVDLQRKLHPAFILLTGARPRSGRDRPRR